MKVGEMDFLENKLLIAIPDTKTYKPRSFVVTNPEWLQIVTNYKNLCPINKVERFFL